MKKINANISRMMQSYMDGIEQAEKDLKNAETADERGEALSRIRFNEYMIRALARWVICYPGETPEAFINHETRPEVTRV